MFRRDRDSAVDRALAQERAYGPLQYLWVHDVSPRLPKWRENLGAADLGRQQLAVLDTLSEGRLLVLTLYTFTSEVNNGGVEQYLWNSSGDMAEELLAGLKRLGAEELAGALELARDEIFNGPVPRDIETRRAAMRRYFGTHPFNDDDDQGRLGQLRESKACHEATDLFYDLELDLVGRFRSYLAEHRDQFGGD